MDLKKRKILQEVNKWPERIREIQKRDGNDQDFEMFVIEIFTDLVFSGVVAVGKVAGVNGWESVCVRVKNVEKNVFFAAEYWESCKNIWERLEGEGKIWGVKIKETERKTENGLKKCVKVSYLSLSTGVASHFSQQLLLGAHEDLVESLILKLPFDGPSWFLVKNPEKSKTFISNCKQEFSINTKKDLQKIPNSQAKINLMALHLTFEKSKVLQIAWAVYKDIDPEQDLNTEIQSNLQKKISWPEDFPSEKEMINYFLMKIYLIDPDVICGFKLQESLYLLLKQIRILEVKNWSRLGKLKKSRFPNENVVKSVMNGRVLYEDNGKINDLEGLCKSLHVSNVISSSLLVANVAGALWSKVLEGGVLYRNELAILHELHREKYVLLSKKPQNSEKKKEKFKGGLVLDPFPGLYDIIIEMDFNSLYPSIIREYEICFTREKILPRIIEKIISLRKVLKEETQEKNLTETKQKALKNLANSLYGSLGCEYFRFYHPKIAEKIAEFGRNILSNSVQIVSNFGYEVIYGDTDSLMIKVKTHRIHDAKSIGKYLEQRINQSFKFVQISLRMVYSRFILIQKKNYAGLTLNEAIDIKGLIRGNNSEFCQELIRKSIEILLKKDFQNMLDFVKAESLRMKYRDSEIFLIPDQSEKKSIKRLGDNTVNYPWYLKKEIEPFVQKISNILAPGGPDSEFYFLCRKDHKHKIFIIQDFQIVTECNECKGLSNESEKFTENQVKNLITIEMKEKVLELYNRERGGKSIRKYCEGKDMKKFNFGMLKIKECTSLAVGETVVDRISKKSAYFLVDLKRYTKLCDYSILLNSLM